MEFEMIVNQQASERPRSASRKHLIARTGDVLSREIGFIPNPCFRELDDSSIWKKELAEGIGDLSNCDEQRNTRSSALPAHLERMCSTPLLSSDDECDLFRRMNYLKYRANAIRSTLNQKRPSERKLEQFDSLLEKANAIRNLIAKSNVRLVVSIVRKFANDSNSFDDLLSEGITCLLNAIAKFDYGRGFRFSTYATMAIRREVYRAINRSHRDRTRFSTGSDAILEQQVGVKTPEDRTESSLQLIRRSLMKALRQLDDREQFIVQARFGLVELGGKPTFSRLGEKLGVSKERVRQLEQRAMNKLRNAIRSLQLVELFELVDPSERTDWA